MLLAASSSHDGSSESMLSALDALGLSAYRACLASLLQGLLARANQKFLTVGQPCLITRS